MSGRIVWFDLEATGLDTTTERIVEFAFLDGATGQAWVERVNPGVPVPPEVTAVHGISDTDVAECPPFVHFAPRIQALIEGAVLAGYNSRRFDLLLLDAELRRAGQPGVARDAQGRYAVQEIDLFQLWLRHEGRSLTSAAKRFAGVELGQDAHSADADTLVLPAVLEGMRQAFGLAEATVAEIAALSVPDGEVDRDGKFRRNEDGVIVFNFTKQKGEPCHCHPDLLDWMLRKDFSAETKAVARAILEEVYGSVEDDPEPELPF